MSVRNPKWHRDEILLALDLYFRSDRGAIDAKNPNIIALSQELNQLPIFTDKPDLDRFRNPNGVSLKLSNFLAIDPQYPGKGMSSYSKLDKEIFAEFDSDRQRLQHIVALIRATVNDEKLVSALNKIEDDELTQYDSVLEGQIIYKLHKLRERNVSIIKAKKRVVLNARGCLKCEVCGFDFEKTYGVLGKGFIECHHNVPLSEYELNKSTNLDDLSIVCSNCHRMLHRGKSIITISELKHVFLNV